MLGLALGSMGSESALAAAAAAAAAGKVKASSPGQALDMIIVMKVGKNTHVSLLSHHSL